MFKDRCCGRLDTYQNQEYPEAVMANSTDAGMNYGYSMNMGMVSNGCVMPPVYECPQERVCNRDFIYEVPHIIPINTRIINHHIYKHSYSPCYTSCEENVVSNIYDGCPNKY